MVFGDNNNDIGMLDLAEQSYAVETAPDAVKEHANYICPSWKDKGVYQVLKEKF
jgi:hydroxymethylpyrimidine pyrophosphatase-like HAD family hydrolase